MTRLFSHLEPLNLRRSWWIRCQTILCQHTLILRCFQWLLSTQNCRLSVSFLMIPINSSPYIILDNFKFQATSPIHWINRLPSSLKLKSLILNLSSTKRLVTSLLIKDSHQAIHFQFLKIKKIRKSIWKQIKREREPFLYLWNMKLLCAHIRFQQVIKQTQRIT